MSNGDVGLNDSKDFNSTFKNIQGAVLSNGVGGSAGQSKCDMFTDIPKNRFNCPLVECTGVYSEYVSDDNPQTIQECKEKIERYLAKIQEYWDKIQELELLSDKLKYSKPIEKPVGLIDL